MLYKPMVQEQFEVARWQYSPVARVHIVAPHLQLSPFAPSAHSTGEQVLVLASQRGYDVLQKLVLQRHSTAFATRPRVLLHKGRLVLLGCMRHCRAAASQYKDLCSILLKLPCPHSTSLAQTHLPGLAIRP